MKRLRIVLALLLAGALALTAAGSKRADAQGQTIKIGILYDHSGPFSAAGSVKFGSVSPEATVWISPPWTRSTV